MANLEHLAVLNRGVKAWNEWRKENPIIRPDLTNAGLNEAVLNVADLSHADLRQAMLHKAHLVDANLSCSDLSNAFMRRADLHRVNLSDAILNHANLVNTTLQYAILCRAKLVRADLMGADLYKADLTNADLEHAILKYARLVETKLQNANLTGSAIYGVSVWQPDMEGALQSDLIITRPEEPMVTVDDLEVAQFIYLLLNNQKIRSVIDTVARKAVLILGRFTPERKAVLDAIREALRKKNYLPILFDFDKPTTRDYTETMSTLAHLSRFIIADLSDPKSIPLELQAVVPELAVPVQPLLLSGQSEFSMFVDLRKKYHWVLATHQYTDIADLLASLGDKVIAPAEQKAKELEKR